MIGHILIATVLSFTAVFLKTFQQQNIVYKRTLMIIPTSYGLSYSDMFLMALFAKTFLDYGYYGAAIAAFCIGTANWAGCLLSMKIHYWVVKKLYKSEQKV